MVINYEFNGEQFDFLIEQERYKLRIIELFAKMYGLKEWQAKEIIDEWIDQKELEYQFKDKIKKYFEDEAFDCFQGR